MDKVYIYDTNPICTSKLHTSVSMLAIAMRSGCSDLNSLLTLLTLLTLLSFLYKVTVLPREQNLALRYSVISYHICRRFARFFYRLN